MENTKCLIVGAGPAGYTAAIYAGRAALDPVVIEGPEPGGQLTTTHIVENYPGFAEGIDARALMDSMRAQAERFGAKMVRGSVVSCDLASKSITLDDGTQLSGDTLIIATGASAKYLGLESESRFRGRGGSACATCVGLCDRRRMEAEVGGGDSACEEALYLSSLASKVYMIVRKDYLRASEANKKRIAAAPNIEVLFGSVTREVLGDESGVTGARLEKNGELYDIQIDGFFLAIGRHPNAEWLEGQLPVDENGYIITDGVKTAVPGVFVAGDVRNTDFRQAVTAASDGCRAALEAEKYYKNEIQ